LRREFEPTRVTLAIIAESPPISGAGDWGRPPSLLGGTPSFGKRIGDPTGERMISVRIRD